jgi:hypothetical protein
VQTFNSKLKAYREYAFFVTKNPIKTTLIKYQLTFDESLHMLNKACTLFSPWSKKINTEVEAMGVQHALIGPKKK